MYASRTYRVDKRAEIEKDGVEGDHTGGLERIAVDYVAGCHGVPDLNSCCDWYGLEYVHFLGEGGKPRKGIVTEEESHLPYHPVVVFVNTDTPED